MGDMGVLSRYLTVGAGAAVATLALAGSLDGLDAREFRAADIQEESYPTEATSIAPLTLDRDPQNRRPVWPPRTSPKIPD